MGQSAAVWLQRRFKNNTPWVAVALWLQYVMLCTLPCNKAGWSCCSCDEVIIISQRWGSNPVQFWVVFMSVSDISHLLFERPKGCRHGLGKEPNSFPSFFPFFTSPACLSCSFGYMWHFTCPPQPPYSTGHCFGKKYHSAEGVFL